MHDTRASSEPMKSWLAWTGASTAVVAASAVFAELIGLRDRQWTFIALAAAPILATPFAQAVVLRWLGKAGWRWAFATLGATLFGLFFALILVLALGGLPPLLLGIDPFNFFSSGSLAGVVLGSVVLLGLVSLVQAAILVKSCGSLAWWWLIVNPGAWVAACGVALLLVYVHPDGFAFLNAAAIIVLPDDFAFIYVAAISGAVAGASVNGLAIATLPVQLASGQPEP